MTETMMSATPNFDPSVLSPESSPQVSHLFELIRAATELVFLVDPDKKVVYVGQSISALLGYDPLDIIGQPIRELVHPNHATPFEGAIDQVFRGAKLGEAELRFPHKSGLGSLPLMVGFSPLKQENVTEGTMVTARHAGTKKAMFAALNFDDETAIDLGNSAPVVMFLLDERGRCTWMNPTWTALSGQPVNEASGLGWLAMLEQSDRDGFRSVAAQAHQRQSGWRHQFRIRSTHDELYWIDGAAAPRFSADNSVSGYIVVLADITAEVRARAELNKRTTIVESNADYVVMDERSQRLIYGSDGAGSPLASTPPLPSMDSAEDARPSLGAIPTDQQAQYLNEIRPTVLSSGVWQSGMEAPRANSSFGDIGEPATATQKQTAADGVADEVDPDSEPKAPLAHQPELALQHALLETLRRPSNDAVALVEAEVAPSPATEAEAEFVPSFEFQFEPTVASQEVLATTPISTTPISTTPVAAPRLQDMTSGQQPVAWNFEAPVADPGPIDGWKGPSWSQSAAASEVAAPLGLQAPAEQVYVGLVGPSGSVESIASVSDAVLEPTEFEIADMLPAVDPVTGLANRALFLERIRLALHRMNRDGVSVAVMLANIHGYDELRQQVGAKTGDDQLFVIAKRLEATIRQVDTAARIGDSDFAVLGVGWFFPGDVENAARRFMLKIQEPLPSIGRQAVLPASMGIAIAQPDESISTLLRRAQRARKIAFGLGSGSVYVDNGPGREPSQS